MTTARGFHLLGRRAAASDTALGAVTTVLTQSMLAKLSRNPAGAHVLACRGDPQFQQGTYLNKMKMHTRATRRRFVKGHAVEKLLATFGKTHGLSPDDLEELLTVSDTGEGITSIRDFDLSDGNLTAMYAKYYIYTNDRSLFHVNIASARASQQWQNMSDAFKLKTTSKICGYTWKSTEQHIETPDVNVCLSEEHRLQLQSASELEAVHRFSSDFPGM